MEQQSAKQIRLKEYAKKYRLQERSQKAEALDVYYDQCVKFINAQIHGKKFTRKEFYKAVGIYHFKKSSHPIDNFRMRFEKLGYMDHKGHKFWVVKSIPEGFTHKQLIAECAELNQQVNEIISADLVEISMNTDGTVTPGYTNVKYKNN